MLVFVYGTLRKGQGNHRLLTNDHYVLDGCIKGEMYSLGGFPGVVNGIQMVKGEMYRVTALESLDRLEGHPHMYTRRMVDVYDKELNNVLCQAWTYFYNGPVNKEGLIDNGDWNSYVESKDYARR